MLLSEKKRAAIDSEKRDKVREKRSGEKEANRKYISINKRVSEQINDIKINEVPTKRKRLNECEHTANKVFPLQECEVSGFLRPSSLPATALPPPSPSPSPINIDTMAAPNACTRFSDNYDIKEELGK